MIQLDHLASQFILLQTGISNKLVRFQDLFAFNDYLLSPSSPLTISVHHVNFIHVNVLYILGKSF